MAHMDTFIEELKGLHTQVIDSREGYEAALAELEDVEIKKLVEQMIAMRSAHHQELDQCLRSAGENPDESGSFMSTVHRTIIKVRSIFTGVNKNIIPGLIDGESRILDQYADAINASDRPHITQTLLKQSNELEGKIRALKALETSTA